MVKTEILAPAGSYETMQAAFSAGADAVYLAGRSFGARAYANNLDEENLIRAIDEAHMRGKKLYLTVNTLLKEKEIKEQLLPYLTPLYEDGLDAVIVQDFGVLKVIHECFPGLDIHASTQMTVTDGDFAAWLKQFGVTRVVPARELSLEEIRKMKEKSRLEIETFVHGALCYCYSGQCLLSSMIGGRSGNRGRCAQPCRLPYELVSEQGRLNKAGENYLLSPKDIAALRLIPDLVDAGIDSLKIEGRMKKPEYAALVSALYRKYVDLYEEKGREGFVINEEDIHDLMDLYNRGGFTDGYYKQHNGRNMMSLTRPNHAGTQAAKVVSLGKDGMRIKALKMLHPQDVLEMPIQSGRDKKRQEFTLKEGADTGKQLFVRGRFQGTSPGDVLYRTRNQKLIDSVSETYVFSENKEKIYGTLTISKDLPVKMTVEHRGISVSVCGETALKAANKPLLMADVKARMEKTGNTPYTFEKLEIRLEDGVYVSVKGLNQLRRDALSALDEARRAHYARTANVRPPKEDKLPDTEAVKKERRLSVLLGSRKQLEAVVSHDGVSLIYMEISHFDKIEDKKALTASVHHAGKQLYIALPHIFREDVRQLRTPAMAAALEAGVDGFLIRNMEALFAVRLLDETIPVISDASVYTFNSEARNLIYNSGIARVTAPLELNAYELERRGCTGDEAVVYGYMPLMVSAQCPMKTTGNCLKGNKNAENIGEIYLKDRIGERFRVKPFCKYCYSVIYNSKPLMLADELLTVSRLGFSWARLALTTESAAEVKILLDVMTEGFVEGKAVTNCLETFTKGHFRRGVE